MKLKKHVLYVKISLKELMDKTLEGIHVVYDLIAERFFVTPGIRTKLFELIFFRTIKNTMILVLL